MVSTPRLGIAIRDEMVAITVRQWRSEDVVVAERPADEPWQVFLARLLAETQRTSWRRPSLGVCVADRRCRVIPLFGVDAALQRDEVTSAFAQSPQSFTIPGPDGLVAGSVWRGEQGWQGVVLASALAGALVGAARTAGLELRAVAPSDGPAGDDLSALARGACDLTSTHKVIVDPERSAREGRTLRVRRGSFAAVAILAATWALIAPAVLQAHATWALEREAAPAAEYLATATRSDSLREQAMAFGSLVAVVETGRGDVTALLDLVGDALGDSSAITALRLEPRSGALTVLAPDASESLARLVAIPSLRQARISGPIEREAFGGLTLERTTLTWEQARARR